MCSGKDAPESARPKEGRPTGRVLLSECYVQDENPGTGGEEIKGVEMKQINACKEEGSRKENGIAEEQNQWFKYKRRT